MKRLEATEILLTTKQLAKLLNIPYGSIESGRSTGTFPIPHIKIGRRIRYRLCDVEAHMEANQRYHTSESAIESAEGKKPSTAINSVVNNGMDNHTEPKITPPIPAPTGTTEMPAQKEYTKTATMDKYQIDARKVIHRVLAKAQKEGKGRPTNEKVLGEVEDALGEDSKTYGPERKRSELTRIRWVSQEAEKLGMKSTRGRRSKKKRPAS
jgi:hypothetical protein